MRGLSPEGCRDEPERARLLQVAPSLAEQPSRPSHRRLQGLEAVLEAPGTCVVTTRITPLMANFFFLK